MGTTKHARRHQMGPTAMVSLSPHKTLSSEHNLSGSFSTISVVIDNFGLQTSLDSMPSSELCSQCFLGRLQMMQQSAYSIFNIFSWYQEALQVVVLRCQYLGATSTKPPPIPVFTPTPCCISGKTYLTKVGDACDGIAL